MLEGAMVSFTVKYDKKVFDELQKQIAAAPTTMNIYTTTTIRKEIENFVTRKLVNVNIPRPTYPLVWRSERQRKFVMAKLRKSGNLPYKRTRDFQKAWKTIAVKNGGESVLSVSNDSNITEYVSGSSSDRQPMFPQWYHYEDALLEAEELATDLAINAWYDIGEYGEVQAGSLRSRKR
jgi:hypothetical protein